MVLDGSRFDCRRIRSIGTFFFLNLVARIFLVRPGFPTSFGLGRLFVENAVVWLLLITSSVLIIRELDELWFVYVALFVLVTLVLHKP